MANEAAKGVSLDELAVARPLRLLFKYAIPSLVAMSLNALYAVVDRFYIGRGCGEDAMSALTIVLPVMMVFNATGVLIGAGHSALLSIKLGAGDRRACGELLGEMVAMKLLLAAVLPPVVWLFAPEIVRLGGGDRVTAAASAYAVEYLRIVVFSQGFSHLAFGLSAMMRAEGDARRSMICMVVGFGVNLALDPLFIFGFGLDVAGAAWATDIAMVASCAYALHHYCGGHSSVPLEWRRVRLYRAWAGRACAIGFSPCFQQLLGALINVSLTVAFARWAADEQESTRQIASLGVFQVLLIMTLMPVLGAQQGLQPILGYNWGARAFRRVRSTLWWGMAVTSAMCAIACMLQAVPPFPRWLASAFVSADNPALLDLAAHDLVVSNCFLWCIGLNIVMSTYYQSIGHPGAAIGLSVLRQGVIMLPMIWFLPRFMDDKMLAVWLCMPVSDVLCCLATLPFFLQQWLFLTRVRSREPLAAEFRKETR